MRMTNKTKLFGAVAVAGIVAASGSAFTDSVQGVAAAKTLGYGATTVTGATLTSETYAYSTDKSEITSITLVFSGDVSTNTVELGFNAEAPVSCSPGIYATSSTTVTCDGSNFVSRAVSGVTKVGIAVS